MNAGDFVNGRTGIAAAALLATVGLGFTSAQTPTMAAPGGMSEIAKLAAKGGLDAVDAMLDARSPGFRAPGALTQTKARRVASLKDAFDPKERVLSGERTRPVDPAAPAIAYEQGQFAGPSPYTPAPAPVTGAGPGVGDGAPLPAPVWFGGGGGTTPIVVAGGGGGSGGGGGGGGGGGSTIPGGDTPGVGSAVPEPATWISLLIGFFAIGFGLRGGMAVRPARRRVGRAVQ